MEDYTYHLEPGNELVLENARSLPGASDERARVKLPAFHRRKSDPARRV